MKIIWRPLFVVDVEQAADYFSTEAGEETAIRWQNSLNTTLVLLKDFPEIGRVRSDLPVKDIRSFHLKNFPNWLVFYRVGTDQIELLRVRHGMMHLPALFEPGSES